MHRNKLRGGRAWGETTEIIEITGVTEIMEVVAEGQVVVEIVDMKRSQVEVDSPLSFWF